MTELKCTKCGDIDVILVTPIEDEKAELCQVCFEELRMNRE